MLINLKKQTNNSKQNKTPTLLVPDGQTLFLKKYFCYQFKFLRVQNYTGRLSRTKPNKMAFTYKEKKSKRRRKGKYLAVNNNIFQSLQLCELAMETTSNTCF